MMKLFLTGVLLAQSALGFAPSRHIHVAVSLSSTKQSNSEAPLSSFHPSKEKLATFVQSIQRPRGVSVGVEYAPLNKDDNADVSILSMQLRKSNAKAIYTSNLAAMRSFIREQETSRGNFPGPVPVVYYSPSDDDEGWREAVNEGANLMVLTYDDAKLANDNDYTMLNDVGVIWKISEFTQIHEIIEKEMGNVFLLSDELLLRGQNQCNNITTVDLQQKLLSSTIPETAVLIAPLPSMLPENNEITLGKSLSSDMNGLISSLLIKSCCINDDEDIKYAQFVIDGISKKSSNTFSMTGLTGSTNGHFGVSSHGENVKWRRKM